jgi:hypothetical protein
LFAAFWAVFSGQRSASAFVRHTLDDEELAAVRAATPAAADAYAEAEARLRAGDLAAADKLLAKARALNEGSFLLARRHCQVLTELGQRAAALAACKAALAGGTAMDERAYVGVLMSGKELVNPKDLADAMREAANAKRLRGQPFGDVASCEIAHHIGDDAMFTACLAGLEKNAPGYFETTRWKNARTGTPVWFYWLGWSLLAALGAVMLAQGFWRWFKKPATPARKAGTAAAVVIALSAAFAGTAHAEGSEQQKPHYQLSQFPINFDDPESRIPTIEQRNANALEFGYFLQDLSAEALKAERNSDFRKAVKFWRASAKAVPDEAVAFSRACRVYQILEERDNAIHCCAKAINLHGVTTADYMRFSELVVSTPNPLTDSEVEDLDAAVKHLRAQPNGEGPAAVVECQLGVKLEDEARLAHCTAVLAKNTPNDPHALTFQWSLAMKRHNFSEARRLLAAMSKASMAPAALAQLQAATDKAATWWRRPFVDPRYGFGVLAVLGLLALFVLRKRAQFRAPPPNAAPAA